MTQIEQSGGKPVVAAFDFDGTITTRDTFVPFIFRAFGKPRVLWVFFTLSLDAIKVALGLSSRDKLKARVIGALFHGDRNERLLKLGREHAVHVETWFRPKALARIEWHREAGHRLVMVSASLNVYLEPVAKKLGFNDLLCTELSDEQLFSDGRFTGKNCRGPEKIKRLESLLGNLSDYELYAYGDSAGDREMLAVANHPYYRAFESGAAAL